VVTLASLNVALRMLARDWRAGELSVLGIALVLAVAALTSVGFLTDRVEQALRLQSHQLLGGDLLLSADHPWPEGMRQEAAARGLRLAQSVTFASMVSLGDNAVLAEIKAVSEGYPAARQPAHGGPSSTRRMRRIGQVPARGEAWGDERLVQYPELSRRHRIGRWARSTAAQRADPDAGAGSRHERVRAGAAPDDQPRPICLPPGLILPGSRVGYRLHVAGETEAVKDPTRPGRRPALGAASAWKAWTTRGPRSAT
jgi:putative ABC transport system permease protein